MPVHGGRGQYCDQTLVAFGTVVQYKTSRQFRSHFVGSLRPFLDSPALVLVVAFLDEVAVLRLPLLGVVLDGAVVDLRVAHGMQWRQQRGRVQPRLGRGQHRRHRLHRRHAEVGGLRAHHVRTEEEGKGRVRSTGESLSDNIRPEANIFQVHACAESCRQQRDKLPAVVQTRYEPIPRWSSSKVRDL